MHRPKIIYELTYLHIIPEYDYSRFYYDRGKAEEVKDSHFDSEYTIVIKEIIMKDWEDT